MLNATKAFVLFLVYIIGLQSWALMKMIAPQHTWYGTYALTIAILLTVFLVLF